jgi:hypothetical protein
MRIRLSTDKDIYEPLEPISCHWEFENMSNHDVIIHPRYPTTEYQFEVLFSDGRPCPLTCWGKAEQSFIDGSISYGPLPPGAIQSSDFRTLNWSIDMTRPGKYRITADRQVADPVHRGQSVDLRSNTVEVDVEMK